MRLLGYLKPSGIILYLLKIAIILLIIVGIVCIFTKISKKHSDKTKKRKKAEIIITAVMLAPLVVFSLSVFLLKVQVTSLTVNTDKYDVYSYNIECTETGRKIKSAGILSSRSYYRIKDIRARDFIMLSERKETAMLDAKPAVILKHQKSDAELILDSGSAKLMLGETKLADIDQALVEDIAYQFKSGGPVYSDIRGHDPDRPRDVYRSGSGNIEIKFSIEGYDNLEWIGKIAKNDEGYFIVVYIGEDVYSPSGERYLPCGEELSAFIDTVLETYN